jgi:hypothetical protein
LLLRQRSSHQGRQHATAGTNSRLSFGHLAVWATSDGDSIAEAEGREPHIGINST